jgi:integrase
MGMEEVLKEATMQQNSRNHKRLTPCEPFHPQTTRPALSRQEWERLFAVSMSPDFREKNPCLMLVIALGTFAGLRISEIVRLRWDDIDHRRRIMNVRQSPNPLVRRFTVQEVAKMLHVKVSTVNRWLRNGSLRLPGNRKS